MKRKAKTILGATSVKIGPPVNQKGDYLFFSSPTVLQLPLVKLYTFKNANMLDDGCIFQYFKPVEESFVLTTAGYQKIHNWKGLIALAFKGKHVKLRDDLTYVVAHNSYSGYFHFLAEILPRLYLLKNELGRLVLLLPELYRSSFVFDALKAVGVSQVYWLQKDHLYHIPRLLFPTVTAPQRHYNPVLIKRISNDLIEKTSSASPPFYATKLYIVRKRAAKRKILNEREVVSLMEENGFKCIELEDFSFSQQVQLCRQAKTIVSIHGAGLTNIMFMGPGSKVLELRKDDGGEMYYYHTLASAVDINYYYQFCKSDKSWLPVNTADLIVDLELLRQNLVSLDES
jgi:hypothetical protein